jgi:hypothetical protein
VVKGVRLIVIILLAATVVGCSRYIESRDPVRSLPDAGPVPINLTARLDNGSITISWEVVDNTDIARFRVYVADSNGINYTPWDSTTGYSITLEGLNINQRYFLKVATVSYSGLESKLSEAITARVMYLSIMIQSDQEYANSRNVQVQISSPQEETSHLMLSENSTFSDAAFVPFVGTQTDFTLSEGDGIKTIYARLQFFDGTQSGILSDDIVLDTRVLPVELFVVAEPEMSARLIWTVSEEDDFDHYRVFASSTAGVNPPDKVIALINDQSTNTYSYSAPSIGQFYFQVFVHDKYGNSTGSNIIDVTLTQ